MNKMFGSFGYFLLLLCNNDYKQVSEFHVLQSSFKSVNENFLSSKIQKSYFVFMFIDSLFTPNWTLMSQGICGSPGLPGPRGKPGPQVFSTFKHQQGNKMLQC